MIGWEQLTYRGIGILIRDYLNDQVKTVQVERQTLQEEHDRLMGRQSLLLQELASKEKG